MSNPWRGLSEKLPYILECDREAVENFNQRVGEGSLYYIYSHQLPDPFLGAPNAPIVLLNLNPGFNPEDNHFHDEIDFIEANRKNLNHENQEYPFYALDPRFAGWSGYEWWGKKLKRLIEKVGSEKLSRRIFCVEYFPYHSQNFGFNTILESQQYGFYLVRRAIKRKAIIIIMRSRKKWYEAVPELKNYPSAFCLNNPQNVAISENNLPLGVFAKVIEVLARNKFIACRDQFKSFLDKHNALLESDWLKVALILGVLLFVVFYASSRRYYFDEKDITKALKCPDEYATSEEAVAAFEIFTNNFFDKHFNATLDDFLDARVQFLEEHN